MMQGVGCRHAGGSQRQGGPLISIRGATTLGEIRLDRNVKIGSPLSLEEPLLNSCMPSTLERSFSQYAH